MIEGSSFYYNFGFGNEGVKKITQDLFLKFHLTDKNPIPHNFQNN